MRTRIDEINGTLQHGIARLGRVLGEGFTCGAADVGVELGVGISDECRLVEASTGLVGDGAFDCFTGSSLEDLPLDAGG